MNQCRKKKEEDRSGGASVKMTRGFIFHGWCVTLCLGPVRERCLLDFTVSYGRVDYNLRIPVGLSTPDSES